MIDEIIKIMSVTKIESQPPLKRATSGSAGYELYTLQDIKIHEGEMVAVETEVSLTIPPGYYFQILQKSGLAYRNQLITLAGVIDSDYTGTIKVLLFNLGKKTITIEKGKSVAQGVLFKYETFENEEIINKTVFDHSGFGSTNQ